MGTRVEPRFAGALARRLRRGTLRAKDRQPSALIGRVLSRMRQDGKLTWEACIDFATELLKSAEEVAASVRFHDRFLLVDEAQDCDPAQLNFLDQLLGGDEPSHLFVAMDPDQSLYAFRDADPDLVLRWARSYSPDEFELTENFRCKPRITTVARHVLGKAIRSDGGSEGTAHFYHGKDRDGEAQFVAEKVVRKISEGTPAEKIAVLARKNHLLDGVRTALIDSGVTVRRSASKDFSRQEQAVLGVLHFLHEWEEGNPAGPQTAMILRRLFNIPEKEIRESEAEASSGQVHPGETLVDPRWQELCSLRESRMHPSELIQKVAQIFHWDLGDDVFLRTLAANSRTLSQLLRQARSGSLPETLGRRGVLVGSFHASKGLEFNAVFILACEDGIIPDYRARTDHALQQERRALYVAMTRASDELVVSCSGRGRDLPRPSRFLPASKSPLWSASK